MKQHTIICAGMPASASTWTINVAAELIRAQTPEIPVKLIFGDRLDERVETEMSGASVALIKTHVPDPAFRFLATRTGTPVIMTIRNPLDCIASFMQRFAFSFDDALGSVSTSCKALMRLADCTDVLLLRYEDGFSYGSAGVDAIARHISVSLPDAERRRIADKLSPQQVAAHIARMEQDGTFDDRPASAQWEKDTHWHPRHVGDGAVGKHRQVLSDVEIALAGFELRAFCDRFDYDISPPALPPGSELRFSKSGTGLAYLQNGVRHPEPWGIWIVEPRCTLKLPLTRPIGKYVRVALTCSLSPNFAPGETDFMAEISMNGAIAMRLPTGTVNTLQILLHVDGNSVEGLSEILIEFNFSNLKSPLALGKNDDDRTLALGLIRAQVHFD